MSTYVFWHFRQTENVLEVMEAPFKHTMTVKDLLSSMAASNHPAGLSTSFLASRCQHLLAVSTRINAIFGHFHRYTRGKDFGMGPICSLLGRRKNASERNHADAGRMMDA